MKVNIFVKHGGCFAIAWLMLLAAQSSMATQVPDTDVSRRLEEIESPPDSEFVLHEVFHDSRAEVRAYLHAQNLHDLGSKNISDLVLVQLFEAAHDPEFSIQNKDHLTYALDRAEKARWCNILAAAALSQIQSEWRFLDRKAVVTHPDGQSFWSQRVRSWTRGMVYALPPLALLIVRLNQTNVASDTILSSLMLGGTYMLGVMVAEDEIRIRRIEKAIETLPEILSKFTSGEVATSEILAFELQEINRLLSLPSHFYKGKARSRRISKVRRRFADLMGQLMQGQFDDSEARKRMEDLVANFSVDGSVFNSESQIEPAPGFWKGLRSRLRPRNSTSMANELIREIQIEETPKREATYVRKVSPNGFLFYRRNPKTNRTTLYVPAALWEQLKEASVESLIDSHQLQAIFPSVWLVSKYDANTGRATRLRDPLPMDISFTIREHPNASTAIQYQQGMTGVPGKEGPFYGEITLSHFLQAREHSAACRHLLKDLLDSENRLSQ